MHIQFSLDGLNTIEMKWLGLIFIESHFEEQCHALAIEDTHYIRVN